jgi:hypothetical protein
MKLNLYNLLGEDGIKHGADLSPFAAVALRCVFVVSESAIKLQASFRRRIAVKRVYSQSLMTRYIARK